MEKKVLNEMFDNLLHIGNKSNYWNSKMKDYIYGSVNWVHVINLIETAKKLEEVKTELKDLATQGKKILFVATKLQARDSFEKLATETGHYYVTEKWVPWLLTNFKTIKWRIATYLKLLRDFENGAFDMLSKKEKAAKKLELEKLDKWFKWLKEMKKVPEVVFVVDGIYEQQAIKEANTLKLDVFAIFNTNGDDTVVSNLIPANTNSVKSIEFLANSLTEVLKWIKVKRPEVKKVVVKKPLTRRAPEKKVIVKKDETKPVEKKVIKKEEVKEEVKVEEKAPAKKEETKTEEK